MPAQLSEPEILDILESCGAFIRHSHIVYTSGLHGHSYMNKDALYPHTHLTSKLCREIANRFSHDVIDVVLAPALGGIILSQWVAHHLTELTGREVLAVYAEKDGESFMIKRGYDKLIEDKAVLVLEDVLTTGGSVKKVVEKVKACAGQVVAVAALCNRGGVSSQELGSPRLDSLVNVQWDAWPASECPLCAKGRPLNTAVGKAKKA